MLRDSLLLQNQTTPHSSFLQSGLLIFVPAATISLTYQCYGIPLGMHACLKKSLQFMRTNQLIYKSLSRRINDVWLLMMWFGSFRELSIKYATNWFSTQVAQGLKKRKYLSQKARDVSQRTQTGTTILVPFIYQYISTAF